MIASRNAKLRNNRVPTTCLIPFLITSLIATRSITFLSTDLLVCITTTMPTNEIALSANTAPGLIAAMIAPANAGPID